MSKPNEFKIDVSVDASRLQEIFYSTLKKSLDDKALDAVLDKKITAATKNVSKQLQGIVNAADVIGKLGEGLIDSGNLEQTNAVFSITQTILTEIKDLLLDLGQMSLSDLAGWLKTVNNLSKDTLTTLQGFIKLSGENDGTPTLDLAAIDKEGKARVKSIDDEINAIHRRQAAIKKLQQGTFSIDDLPKSKRSLKPDSIVVDVQRYVQRAQDEYAESLKEAQDKDLQAIMAGDDDASQLALQAKKEAAIAYAQQIVAASNWMKSHKETEEVLSDAWADIYVQATRENFQEFSIDLNQVYDEAETRVQELYVKRQKVLEEVAALGITSADVLAASSESKETNGNKRQLSEKEKAQWNYVKGQATRAGQSIDQAARLAGGSQEVPDVIVGLARGVGNEEKEWQDIYDRISRLIQLQDKSSDLFKSYYQNFDELSGDKIDSKVISQRLAQSYYDPSKVIYKNNIAYPLGAEALYQRNIRVSRKKLASYLDDMEFMFGMQSALEAGVVDSLGSFPSGIGKNGVLKKGGALDTEQLKQKVQPVVSEFMLKAFAQIGSALGKTVEPAFIEETVQTAAPQAASTPNAKPKATPTPEPTPTVSPVAEVLPDEDGAPPNRIVVDVVYSKTAEQMAKELLQLLQQLQEVLDNHPLKFVLDDPDPENGGLQTILKALSKNLTHTITIQVNKQSINSLSSAYFQMERLMNLASRFFGGEDIFDTTFGSSNYGNMLESAKKELEAAQAGQAEETFVSPKNEEQLENLVHAFTKLFESENGQNHFTVINDSVQQLIKSLDQLIDKYEESKNTVQKTANVFEDPAAAESLWFDIQNQSHGLFEEKRHKDALGDVSSYRLIDQESEAYKELSKVLFELYTRYKAIGGVKHLAELAQDDSLYELRGFAPGSADLNRLEQDYAKYSVQQETSVADQFKELLTVFEKLNPKFLEFLELYKTVNRVADQASLNAKWDEVQSNFVKVINVDGTISNAAAKVKARPAFFQSYREYRDLGGTKDFNALLKRDKTPLDTAKYPELFKLYTASPYSPTQTPLGGVNDFISTLGTGASQAAENIELLKSKISGLEKELQATSSLSDFFAKMSGSLEPVKEFFTALSVKLDELLAKETTVSIDPKEIVKPYEDLTRVLEGIQSSLTTILELYKAINGIASQGTLEEQWNNVQVEFNKLLTKRFTLDANKDKSQLFSLFSAYQKAGGINQFSDLMRTGANTKTGGDRPITAQTAAGLEKDYFAYRSQMPILTEVNTIGQTIEGIRASVSTTLAEITQTINSLPNALQTGISVGQENFTNHMTQVLVEGTRANVTQLGETLVTILERELNPLLIQAAAQASVVHNYLQEEQRSSGQGLPSEGKGAVWWEAFSAVPNRDSLRYAQGAYRANPVTLNLGNDLESFAAQSPANIASSIPNLSIQGALQLKQIASRYATLITPDDMGLTALEAYQEAIEQQDFVARAMYNALFEELHIQIEDFLKKYASGKYAQTNKQGTLMRSTASNGRVASSTNAQRAIRNALQVVPLEWTDAYGGKFTGDFRSNESWSGTGVNSRGQATRVSYVYDALNQSLREYRQPLRKETQKNQRAIAKQRQYFDSLQSGFQESLNSEIAGTKVGSITDKTYSDVLGIVTDKTDELSKLRDEILTQFSQGDWNELNDKIALGIVSKTDAEYQRFQNLLDLLNRFEARVKDVGSLVGSSNGEGWLSNNKGNIVAQNVNNDSTAIDAAIKTAIQQVGDQYASADGSGLVGKLSASGQSFSGRLTDAAEQVHDITIAYDEATQSVRVFDQVNTQATESLRKKVAAQVNSVSQLQLKTSQFLTQSYGGIAYNSLNPNDKQFAAGTQAIIQGMQNAVKEYNELLTKVQQNNTSWADVAGVYEKGFSEPFQGAYADLKQFLSLSNKIEGFSKQLTKLLEVGTGAGWVTNNKGKLMGLAGQPDLSPEGAKSHILDYLASEYKLNKSSDASQPSGYIASDNMWQYFGTKTEDGKTYKITVKYDEDNSDLRYFEQEISDTDKKVSDTLGRINISASQMFATFKRVAATLTPLISIINSATQAFQNGYNTLTDYDKALTNISYTMTLSKQQLQELGQATVEMAKNLNLSISDAMSIAQIYANMQTTPEEIVELARPTAILANLAGQSTETAANYVQSVIEQFGMVEEDAMHIVDVYDTISANIKMDYAKGIGVIAGAVEQAGQVAKDAGLEDKPEYTEMYKIRTYLIAGNTLEPCTTIIGKPDYEGLKTQGLVVHAAKRPNVKSRVKVHRLFPMRGLEIE